MSGLVFVATSINLNLGRILAYPSLPTRAWQTLGLLVSPLLIGFFLLVPGQSRTVLAWELIVSAVLLGAGQVAIDRRSVRSEKDTPLPLVGRLAGFVGAIAPALVSYACLTVAGATLLAQGGSGFYWLVPSVLLAFFFGLINPGRCLWVSRSSRSTYFHYSPATCPNRTSSAQYCPAPGRRGRLPCFFGYFGYRVEDFVTASGHRVRSEHERCDWPLDEVEGDKGDGARDEQDVGFVALEDRVKGGEWVRHAPS